MPELRLASPLQYLKGVGPRKAEALAGLGYRTVLDLLRLYPRAYLDRTSIVPINKLRIGEPATIIGSVVMHGLLYGKRRRLEVTLQDETGRIALLFFAGLRYWEKRFERGQTWAASGTIGFFQGLQIVHPELERLDDDSSRMVHAGRIVPVYPQTAELSQIGLTSRAMRGLTTFIFEHLHDSIPDELPPADQRQLGLVDATTAVRSVHYPLEREAIEVARRRLAFDELLELQYFVLRSRGIKQQLRKRHRIAAPDGKVEDLIAALPYALTAGQQSAFLQITADLQREQPMSRLLQGDVGSGKTVVAMLCAATAVSSGLQVAFMAPTEILAAQHFRNWEQLFFRFGIRIELLTASQKAGHRKEVSARCAAGEIDLLLGTHALIYDSVSFPSLGLVIIDEQHRFGVEQRGKLFAKGENPDLLVMTATPIPRTIALTLYGDLDITTIDSLPPGRKPVRTVWRPDSARTKVLTYLKDQVSGGEQAYIVYPLVEKSDELPIQSVEEAFQQLSETELRGLRLGMVHGRMKPQERDETLARFRSGQIDLLLATTVIEVGLDNPNANLLIIEHAERFGLAQLHQLRGRVGRGSKQATVVALASESLSPVARERLDYFVSQTDGFQIAEADLRLRGPGELFGLRQSGLPELKVANLSTDRDLLEAARALCAKLLFPDKPLSREYLGLQRFLGEALARREANLGGG